MSLNWYWYVIAALGLAVLMIVHEAGHFFIARAYGMRVMKFSIGFGPTFFKVQPRDGYYWFTTAADKVRLRLWKHDPEKSGPTVYQVAMIPFLAYVQIAGMNPLEEIDPADRGSYANASLHGRIFTIFAGPAANYLFASVLFFISFFFGGKALDLNSPGSTQITVLPNRAAAAADMRSGDRIVEVAGTKVDTWHQMAEAIGKHPNEAITIVVERDGQQLPLAVKTEGVDGKGKIGVGAIDKRVPVTAKEAAIDAIKTPPLVVQSLVVGLSNWVTGKEKGDLAGPVGMVKETAKAAHAGMTELLYLLGALSAYLGAFNLIPFPALDGGRLMFLAYEATTRRRPNARIEAHIHAIGLVMMLGLMVYITVFKDLRFGAK